MSRPKLIYFNIQGRAEPIRLALAAAGVDFDFEVVDKAAMKSDADHYPFHQVPRYVDDEVDMVQSSGIMRHVARKHGLYGRNNAEMARVEEVLEGCNDLIMKLFVDCIGKMKEDPGATEAYWAARIDPASAGGPATFGAHMAFLGRLLARSSSGYFLESGLSAADLAMTFNMQLHMSALGRERLAEQWSSLVALNDRVLALPRIAAYLASPLHLPVLHPMAG
ncbi:hypothetical protein ABPG77_002313 [Micractinium sp. CCAP 211/92]